MTKLKYSFLFLIFLTIRLYAQQPVLPVNYGPSADLGEGDDDFYSVYYIQIPKEYNERIHLRIFDMNCSGSNDQKFGNWDTGTRFSLFGGNFTTTYSNVKTNNFESEFLDEGDLLATNTTAYSPEKDNQWYNFYSFNKELGNPIDDYFLFKFVIRTFAGDDGNVYDFFISSSPSENEGINGCKIFTFKPSFRLQTDRKYRQINFKIPSNSDIMNVYNFDFDGTELFLSTTFRNKIDLNNSRHGNWESTKLNIDLFEPGLPGHLNFNTVSSTPNDVTLFILDEYNSPIPLEWTPNISESNKVPVLLYSKKVSDDCRTVIFNASESYDPNEDDLQFTWLINEDTVSNSVQFKYDFSKDTIYHIALVAIDNFNGNMRGKYEIFDYKVNKSPVAKISAPVFARPGEEITINGKDSYDEDGSIIQYYWNIEGQKIFGSNKIVHTFSESGDKLITLIVEDNSHSECRYSADTVHIKVNEWPVADAGPDIFTSPGTKFSLSGVNSFDADGSISYYEWNIGDSIITSPNVKYTFKSPGIYSVNLLVKDDSREERAIDYDNVIVFVNAPPKPIIDTKFVVAPGENVKFDADRSSDTDGKIINYKWYIENEVVSGKNIYHIFSQPGLYPIILEVTDDWGADNSVSADTFLTKVNSSPVPEILYQTEGCNTIVTFNASGSTDPDNDVLNLQWDFGGNDLYQSGTVVTHDFGSPGIYPVQVRIDDGQNVSNSIVTQTVAVKINHPPIADAGEDIVACVGKTVFLTGAASVDPEGTPMKYEWDLGDGTYASGINVTKSYNKPGIYRVTLTVEDASVSECNKDMDSKLITVVESPVANAGKNITACTNEVIWFDGSESTDIDGIVNNFFWDFGDGTSTGGVKPYHIFSEPGEYIVTLTITGEYNSECSNTDSDRITVTVHKAAFSSFTSVDSCMANETLTFIADSIYTNYKFLWKINGDSIGTGSRTAYRFVKSGNYNVELTISLSESTGCKGSKYAKNIYVNDSPVAKAGNNILAGVGETLLFDASDSYDPDGNISKYLWDFGNGEKKEGIIVNHSFAKGGEYNVFLEVTDNTSLPGNKSRDSLIVKINFAPVPAIKAPDISLTNTPVSLDAAGSYDPDGSITNYEWFIPGAETKIGRTIEYNFPEPGNYNVTLKVKDDHDFANSYSEINHKIQVIDLPRPDLPFEITSCMNEVITLTWSSSFIVDNNFMINWYLPDGKTINGNKVNFSNTYPDDFILYANLLLNNKIIYSDSVLVNINEPPVAEITSPMSNIGFVNEPLLFDASGSYDINNDALNYYWEFGDGSSSDGIKVLHKYTSAGNYNIKLTVTDNSDTKCSTNSKHFSIQIKTRK